MGNFYGTLEKCKKAKVWPNESYPAYGSSKDEKVKRTASWKNMMRCSDDDDAASPNPKAGTIHGKAKKTAIHKKSVASDALLCCIASKSSCICRKWWQDSL